MSILTIFSSLQYFSFLKIKLICMTLFVVIFYVYCCMYSVPPQKQQRLGQMQISDCSGSQLPNDKVVLLIVQCIAMYPHAYGVSNWVRSFADMYIVHSCQESAAMLHAGKCVTITYTGLSSQQEEAVKLRRNQIGRHWRASTTYIKFSRKLLKSALLAAAQQSAARKVCSHQRLQLQKV